MARQNKQELANKYQSTTGMEHVKIATTYYIKSFFSTFLMMFLLVMVALVTTLIFLALISTQLIKIIFLAQPVRTIFAVLILSTSFTIIQMLINAYTVFQPMREFVKATRQVVNGDYTARIDTKKLRYSRIELIVIGENFNTMVKQLSTVDSLSNDFISNVSHELKTPLAVIQSYATILQNPTLSLEARQEAVSKITHSTQQLTSLITNILRLNKIENDQIPVKNINYDLSSQLVQCVLEYEEAWEEKQITIKFDVDDGIMVFSDPELLYIVWKNLISNAIKFTPDNGIIGIMLIKDGDSIKVKINDSGCGMSQETINHIFEKFYQGDTSHSSIGNGLGLTLVKRVLDITGNEISVESEIDKGTCFTVTLKNEKPKKSLTEKISEKL